MWQRYFRSGPRLALSRTPVVAASNRRKQPVIEGPSAVILNADHRLAIEPGSA